MTQDAIEERGLAVRAEQVQSLLVGTPLERVQQATAISNALAPVISKRKLFAVISGRKHVLFEGWTTLGALIGVFPVVAWTRKTAEGDGWEARVEARTLAGALVGTAEAECTRSETSWRARDSYALRSMAQTRAGSKALRMPLGFIMQLAGFEATPAEEMAGSDQPIGDVPRKMGPYEPAGPTAPPAIPSPKTAPPQRAAPVGDPREGAPPVGDKDQRALYALANDVWADTDAHLQICRALNLPSSDEGAIREHWLARRGTYRQAAAYVAEVRRLQVTQGLRLDDAALKVNAYAKLAGALV